LEEVWVAQPPSVVKKTDLGGIAALGCANELVSGHGFSRADELFYFYLRALARNERNSRPQVATANWVLSTGYWVLKERTCVTAKQDGNSDVTPRTGARFCATW
jgi:hypothetical protein